MSRLLYQLHFRIRRSINYILYYSLYRLKYPDLKITKFAWLCKWLSYSEAALKFARLETTQFILSTSNLLTNNSIVIDVGGDTGLWSAPVYSKYEPNLYIFEPNPESVKILTEKFSNMKVRIFGFGLGSKNMVAQLSNHGMGSSIYHASPEYDTSVKFQIEIRDISEICSELSLDSVDLIKINIEGGEYDLLPGMIESGFVNKCKIIRIQFHDWIPDSFSMRRKIIRELAKTHDIEWSFPMVWESWIRKDVKSG